MDTFLFGGLIAFIFSVLVLIILWRSKDTSTSKAVWTLIVISFPILGACLYLIFQALNKNTKN